MNDTTLFISDLSHEETARLVMDYFQRSLMHHAMWYAEAERQLGRDQAQEALKSVLEQGLPLQVQRLGKALGFEVKDGLPAPLVNLPPETLQKLREAVAANWLANDGTWFQAVEFSQGMGPAKKTNDACWASFSPFEARSIKRFLGLEEKPGLEGLKRALMFRLYASVNRQSISEETDLSFVFQMNDCRVQSARKRKGLDDYPCKSAGIVEYSTFASAIDTRIQTECLACPPDSHPDTWYCSWRFFLAGQST